MKRIPLLIASLALVLIALFLISALHYRRRIIAAQQQLLKKDPLALVYPVPRDAPITIRFLSLTSEPTGTRVANFCMSNVTSRPVVFLADKTWLPYYNLLEYGGDEATHTGTVTNHNQQAFRYVRPATLQPRTGVTFQVRIPAGLTGEVIIADYMPQAHFPANLLEGLRDKALRAVGKKTTSRSYVNYPIREPFENLSR